MFKRGGKSQKAKDENLQSVGSAYSSLVIELESISEHMRTLAERRDDPEVSKPLSKWETAASKVEAAWSGSNLGYHATVYYADFAPPPPGAHFSVEFGLMEGFDDGVGNWREYRREEVHDHIERLADYAEWIVPEAFSKEARAVFDEARSTTISTLSTYLAGHADPYIENLKSEIEAIRMFTIHEAAQAQLRSGRIMSRDMRAANSGFPSAPHQEVAARIVAIRNVFTCCSDLASRAHRTAAHISRAITSPPARAIAERGERIFIGHGRSLMWRELKDFVGDRLSLPWDEFNLVPVAGVTNIARLQDMLDQAGIAFVILTAEDERVDGTMMARQNAIHEAGLFQGRLGFTRAIVLLEEGCKEFSNILGVNQLRFAKGNIRELFGDVVATIKREFEE